MAFADIVKLEAMQRVIGLAKSGDLEIEPSPGRVRVVAEQEVFEAYHRDGCYLSSRLLGMLLTGASNTSMVNESEVRTP